MEKTIILDLFRYSSNTQSTLGVMLFKGAFECDTLEDQSQLKKVSKETRLRAGVWELKLRESLTPLTQKYRDRYDWFEYFIEIHSPEFTGTYIHNGTTEDHTDGCPLVGERNTINTYTAGTLKADKKEEVMKRLYQKVIPILKDKSKRYFIRIVDLDIPMSL